MTSGRHSLGKLEDKALSLLGSGVSSEATSAALGVSSSRISQLLAQPEYAERVVALRYAALQEHNVRDNEYDGLEDKLLEKLKSSLPLLMKPESILKALQVVNSATRRGSSGIGSNISESKNIVQLVLPVKIAEKFTVNINNQVLAAGHQSLETLSSSKLLASIEVEPNEIDDAGL